MFESLLSYSLDRMSSLAHYYENEAKNVMRISKRGMKQHSIGASLDVYFSCLMDPDDEKRKSESFLKFEKEMKKYVDVVKIIKENSGITVLYRFKSKEVGKRNGNIKEERRLFSQFADMPSIHGAASLMMAVTRFEEFISNYLAELYTAFPQKYLNNQTLSYSEIQSSNIEDIKDVIVRREVDAKMRESFKEWFKLFASHGVKCKSFESDLNSLAEIYARRNIYVHNSGKVNPSYLLAVPHSKAKDGERLSVDGSYIQFVFNTFNRIIVLLLIESAKMDEPNSSAFLNDIFYNLFDLLQRQQYEVCEVAFLELCKQSKLNTEFKMMSQVNSWICAKALRGLSTIEKEIQQFDDSALHQRFQLAKIILLEKYDDSNLLLVELLNKKEITSTMIEEWPLFRWYRESEQYSRLKASHPKLFGLRSAEADQHKDDCAGVENALQPST